MRIVRLDHPADFEGWRSGARTAVALGLSPEEVGFAVGEETGSLFGEPLPEAPLDAPRFSVPKAFPELAAKLVCHSDAERFALAYRLLWRLRSEPKLLDIASDPDVIRAGELAKAVQRDSHKMKAFVRFRGVDAGEGEWHYIAWFEPSHHVVELTAPFFMRRFAGMIWTILTPLRSVHWDGAELVFGPGAAREDRPKEDDAEALWLTYYASIFNPARLKVKAMQAEMPKKYWRNLPEAQLIAPLIRGAGGAAASMLAKAPTLPSFRHERQLQRGAMAENETPAYGFNKRPDDLEEAREQARHCRGCDLWEPATQTVFGKGPENAPVIFVGEQPGDQEDLAGEPFIGPAGRLFDQALAAAGIDRDQAYVTNAVKHFKFAPRGKRRIHQKPNAGEVRACRWWLDLEREFIRPKLIVALGATAASSLLGRAVTIRDTRSKLIDLDAASKLLVTVHPAYILRLPDPAAREREQQLFNQDMAEVRRFVPEIALAA